MTKITAVAPDSECLTAPTWLAFLDRVTGGDAELVAFLQRMCGYALTGITREHALFFLHGVGRTARARLYVLTGILGDIIEPRQSRPSRPRTPDHHPTDLAGCGARLCNKRRDRRGRVAESKIKATDWRRRNFGAASCDKIFRIRAGASWCIAGNHRPLRSVDESNSAALSFDPVQRGDPAARAMKSSATRLRAEWPGDFRVDNRGPHAMAANRIGTARGGNRRHRRLPGSRRRICRVD